LINSYWRNNLQFLHSTVTTADLGDISKQSDRKIERTYSIQGIDDFFQS